MKIIKLDATDSTNSYLKKLINNTEIEQGTTVITNDQKLGRGRRGNYWQGEAFKNLYFSFYNKISEEKNSTGFFLNAIASISVYSLLKEYKITNIQIKWPNDILVDSKKISGILIENIFLGKKLKHTVIGIGLNVNQYKFTKMHSATSMIIHTKYQIDIEYLAIRLQQLLIQNLSKVKNDSKGIIQDYNSVLFRRETFCNFLNNENKILSLKLLKVDSNGYLNLVDKKNKLFRYSLDEIKMII